MPLQKWSEDIWLIQLFNEPAFSEELELAISQFAAADPPPHVVVDLGGVDTVNSSNLSQLLRLRKLTDDRQRQLKIAGPSDTVWSVFLSTSLDNVFNFSGDTMTALAELQLMS